MKLPPMSSSTKILIGLAAGVLVGLFLGEHAGLFKVVADGFVKLLQMMVLPYITLSIITSLGALSYDQVKMLGLRAGAVLVCLWCLALIFTFLIPLAFPDLETASFFGFGLKKPLGRRLAKLGGGAAPGEGQCSGNGNVEK
jgi:proton glutamate symport protein